MLFSHPHSFSALDSRFHIHNLDFSSQFPSLPLTTNSNSHSTHSFVDDNPYSTHQHFSYYANAAMLDAAAPAVLFQGTAIHHYTPPTTDADDAASRRSTPEGEPAAKRPRASPGSSATGMSSRDFVPPDTTGLSKREARLLKNRAAAFLSRQRKREEFEQMEARLADLEEENARLRAANGGSQQHAAPYAPNPPDDTARLQAQLAEARAREAELAARLAEMQTRRARDALEPWSSVKREDDADGTAPTASGASSPCSSTAALLPEAGPASRSGSAALGMLVLLCALPSLLAPTSSSAPPPGLIDAFPFHLPIPRAFDASSGADAFSWPGGADADLDFDSAAGGMDIDGLSSFSSLSSLSFAGIDHSAAANEALGDAGEWTRVVLEGAGALEVTFDAQRAPDGSVRVRMQPSAPLPSSSAAASPSTPDSSLLSSPISPSAPAFPPPRGAFADVLARAKDPFLGVGLGAGDADVDAMFVDSGLGLGLGALSSSPAGSGSSGGGGSVGRKRVRIALTRAPDAASGDGGEWVVELR